MRPTSPQSDRLSCHPASDLQFAQLVHQVAALLAGSAPDERGGLLEAALQDHYRRARVRRQAPDGEVGTWEVLRDGRLFRPRSRVASPSTNE